MQGTVYKIVLWQARFKLFGRFVVVLAQFITFMRYNKIGLQTNNCEIRFTIKRSKTKKESSNVLPGHCTCIC